MRTHLKISDTHENWGVSDDVRSKAKSRTGIDVLETLTTNSLGATNEERNFMFTRYEVLGDNLFGLISASISRIISVAQSDPYALMAILNKIDRDGVYPSLKNIAVIRLKLRYSMKANPDDPLKHYVMYLAALSVEEHLRGRSHRSAAYASRVVTVMAERGKPDDTGAEYKWAMDEILDYYS